jgi:glutamate dehydrogenase
MITADPQRRVSTLARILDHVGRTAPDADRDLLLALAPVVYGDMPDPLALRLTPEMISARLAGIFRFVARTMPPAVQLYKGLPGLHVAVRNADDADARAEGSTHEVTIVETHSPDAPFVFESLKNYFQKEGLRVFSSIHPIFSVRRQWERVVWIGGPHEDGSRELYCQFRIERVEARDRLRRIEHQVFSVLKAVFLGVEDFPAMRRGIAEVAPRLRDRRGGSKEADAARSFLDWLMADNYVILGVERYTFGPDGQPHADSTTALGVFKDPALLPVVFPGLMEVQRTHLRPAPGDERVIDVDYCPNAQAIHHLEPIDDVVIREWNADGTLQASTLLLGRLAKGALTAKPQDVPLMREKLAWLLERCGESKNSHAYRETRALFNHMPRRELLYTDVASLKTLVDRMVYMSSDTEIVVTSRTGQGYETVSVAFSDLRYSHRIEEDLKRALSEAFGPISFNTWADLGVIALLVFYFDQTGLEHPIDVPQIHAIVERVISTWEDRVAATLEQTYGPAEGRRLLTRYIRSESRSGMYRESTRPEDVPEDLRRLETIEAQLETHVRVDSADSATLTI